MGACGACDIDDLEDGVAIAGGDRDGVGVLGCLESAEVSKPVESETPGTTPSLPTKSVVDAVQTVSGGGLVDAVLFRFSRQAGWRTGSFRRAGLLLLEYGDDVRLYFS